MIHYLPENIFIKILSLCLFFLIKQNMESFQFDK